MSVGQGVRRYRVRVIGWPVWGLPNGLRRYVVGIVAVAIATAGTAATFTAWHPRDLLLFVLLAGFGAVVIELTRRTPDPAGLIKEVHAAWQLPVALLLPPVYCLLAPAVTFGLLQIRTRRTIAHRRIFSAAANGLSLGAASVVFHSLSVTAGHPLLWLAAVMGCALVWSAANKTLVMTAVRWSDPAVSVREQLFTSGPLLNDVCEIAAATILAGVITGSGLILLVPALPLVIVLQRSFRQAQMLSQSRIDANTGLMTGATWSAEADVEIARAQRTGKPAAVGIVGVDQFRAVYDAYGRQAGDAVLKGVADVLRASLRPDDLVGRFGAEDFSFLLTSTDAGRALQVASRLRANVADQLMQAGHGQEPLYVTVSIGVAATADPGSRDLTDLLAGADAAFDRAKKAGRDRVCVESGDGEDEPNSGGSQTLDDAASGTDDEWEVIDAAWRALGEQLKAWREQHPGMSQEVLGKLIGYSRSAVANAESGKPPAGRFWTKVDAAVGAGGALRAEYARIASARAAARRQTERQAWVARAEATAEPCVASAVPDEDGSAITASACPRCGEHITVKVRVHSAVIPQITFNRPRSAPR